jgi:hypothetical protein
MGHYNLPFYYLYIQKQYFNFFLNLREVLDMPQNALYPMPTTLVGATVNG